jgi:hypothetical protein
MNKSSIDDQGSFWKSHSKKTFGSGLFKWSLQSPGQLLHYRLRSAGVVVVREWQSSMPGTFGSMPSFVLRIL